VRRFRARRRRLAALALLPLAALTANAGNREFDLTAATKERLGFASTGTVLSSK
jgi:hypothetical protein